MPFTLTMPKLSPTMEEGLIVKWRKRIGDRIQPGEVLLEVATDKATVEHQALDEGWMRRFLVQEGENALVNQPIAVLTETPTESLEGYTLPIVAPEAISSEENFPPTRPSEELPKAKGGVLFTQPLFTPEPPLEDYVFEYPLEEAERRVLASPLAKKLAKDKGLDLGSIKGSGPNQRIMSCDLAKAQPLGLGHFNPRKKPTLRPGSYEERPLSPMRKIIAQRLQESKSFIPHFYVTQVIDVEALLSIREQFHSFDVKVSINDWMVRACALALRQHPMINSGFNSASQSIIRFQTIDIAVAVSVDSGLITPIIRHADYKNLGELSSEIRWMAARAREGKLHSADYKGGSFTLSNLGMYGISTFQAILNPPQAAILAVGGIQEVPVVRHGTVVPGKTLTLTLSADHRVIDGSEAARFLQTLKKMVENPAILLT